MELNYQKLGEGPPIFILHGLFGSLDNWRTIAGRLAKDYTVYTVDLRNHGRSPHDPVHSYPAMAADVLELFDREQINTAILMGHSMGGKTAMFFALNYMERLSHLIVVDMPVGPSPPHHVEVIAGLQHVQVETVQSRQEAEDRLAEKIADVAVRQFLLKGLYRKDEGGFGWRFSLPVLVEQYPEMMKGIDSKKAFMKPACFIRGENSNYIKDQSQGDIRAFFPFAKIRSVPNAGHWVHAEAPEGFLQTLGEFLGKTF